MELVNILTKSRIKILNDENHENYIFKGCEYEFYKCRREESLKYSHISDYYIVYFKDEILKTLFSYENDGYNTFQQFQQKLLSTDFFRYKNDLRWNLYLIIVTDNNSSIMSAIPISDIENDENYARKYFFDFDELHRFLNKDEIFYKERLKGERGLETNQLQKWIEILSKVELTGCISNKFSTKSFECYLYEGKPFQDNTLIDKPNVFKQAKNAVYTKIPKRIINVQMGNFRSHCFPKSPQIEPKLINLIHGSNGSGKTSFLEAIEFAITNEIKRLKAFGEDFRNYPSTMIQCEAGDKSRICYKSGNEAAYYKAIDNVWYGVPIGLGKSTLNENFGRFNYFDSDTAYKFALEESKGDKNKDDYQNKFAKLFFDESIVEMQKQWIRYKQEFEEHFYKLNKKIMEDEKQISDLKSLISSVEHTGDINEKEIDLLMGKIGFDCNKLDSKKSINILSYYQDIYDYFLAHESNIRTINECSYIVQPTNYLNISSKKAAIIKEKEDLELKHQNELKMKEEIEGNIQKWKNQISEFESKRVINSNEIKYCIDTISIWDKIKKLVNQPQKIELRKEIKKEIEFLERKIRLVSHVNNKYPNIINLQEEDIFSWDEENIESNERELEMVKKQIAQLEGTIEFAKTQLTRTNNLKLEIRKLANEILLDRRDENNCPLCGAGYSSNEKLIERINSLADSENNDSHISKLQKEKIDLERKANVLSDSVTQYRYRQECYSQLMLAIDAIKYSGLFELPKFSNPQHILAYVKSFMKCSISLEEELGKLLYRLKLLEEEGFFDDNLRELNDFIEINRLYRSYKSDNETIGNFEEYVLTKKNKLLDDNLVYNEEIINIQNNINRALAKLEGLKIEELSKQISKYNIMIKVLENALVAFDQLSQNFNMQNINDFNSWYSLFEFTKERCRIAVDKLNKNNEIGKLMADLKEKEEALCNRKNILKRCKNAIDAFNEMPYLESAVSDFMNRNIDTIKYLFKRIHRPKEFLDIRLGDDGCIWALRGSDGEWLKAHQMSTGQRVSLALSVMFTLFLAAPNAPNFLLLDEPVANLDDLHLLNLMDILREIALQGTQIFFTTANSDVALLFRRKFSFFGDQYRHFNFVRYNEKFSKIFESSYEPNLEEHVSMREIV